jgi:hypothetical protein
MAESVLEIKQNEEDRDHAQNVGQEEGVQWKHHSLPSSV